MKKILAKPESKIETIPNGNFAQYNLYENPFPTTPIVNKDSEEKKFNGSIYEKEIRSGAYEKLLNNFIKVPQSDLGHLRLGFLIDTSYIGRGNGKSAFMVNWLRQINAEFCLDLSNNQNKCFACYFAPEGSGHTKSFRKFVDLFFKSLLKQDIIKYALAILRLDAVIAIKPELTIDDYFQSVEEVIDKLNDNEWYRDEFLAKLGIDRPNVWSQLSKNSFLDRLPPDFPLFKDKGYLTKIITQSDFEEYYSSLRSDADKMSFVFTDLVSMLLASGFNGGYIFVDDFERIPDFQSAIQRKDFATQIRSVLFDGVYLNSKIGFYNFIFALHAGVPRLIQESWSLAGMEQRVPLNPSFADARHVILFDKINEEHVVMLLKKYLDEFRVDSSLSGKIGLFPFENSVAKSIGVLTEFNASRILQVACQLIEYASSRCVPVIDDLIFNEFQKGGGYKMDGDFKERNISNTEAIDLIKKSEQND